MDKLLSTLTKRFGIQSITYAGTAHSIDRAFVKELIDARNALFHASSTPRDNLKKQMDLLILVTEPVVVALLDEHSAQVVPTGSRDD